MSYKNYLACIACSCAAFLLTIPAGADERSGRIDFNKVFELNDELIPRIRITLIKSNAPGCLYFSGERPELTFQLVNTTDKAIKLTGKTELCQFAARSILGDIWNSRTVKLRDRGKQTVRINLPAKGWQNITLKPVLPKEKGCYGLVLDLGKEGRDFLCGIARIFRPNNKERSKRLKPRNAKRK